MSQANITGNIIQVELTPAPTIQVYLEKNAELVFPEISEWDPSWVIPRIADRINLGATAGYLLEGTDSLYLNEPTYPFDVFELDGDGGLHAANDGSSLGFVGTKSIIPVVAGRVYDIRYYGELITGFSMGCSIVSGLGAAVLDGDSTDLEDYGYSNGFFRTFYTALTTRNVALQFPASSGAVAKEFRISQLSIQEIIPVEINDHINKTVCCWGDSHIEGILPYRLRHMFINAYTFFGGVGGEGSREVKARFLARPDLFSQPVIFWFGGNNYYEPEVVVDDIAEMIDALTHTDFIIMGVIGSSTSTIGTPTRTNLNTINAALAAAYPGKFIDIEAYVISLYNPSLPQDVIDHANGVTPTSLRVDYTHLTYDGYDLVAARLQEVFPTFFVYDTVTPP